MFVSCVKRTKTKSKKKRNESKHTKNMTETSLEVQEFFGEDLEIHFLRLFEKQQFCDTDVILKHNNRTFKNYDNNIICTIPCHSLIISSKSKTIKSQLDKFWLQNKKGTQKEATPSEKPNVESFKCDYLTNDDNAVALQKILKFLYLSPANEKAFIDTESSRSLFNILILSDHWVFIFGIFF